MFLFHARYDIKVSLWGCQKSSLHDVIKKTQTMKVISYLKIKRRKINQFIHCQPGVPLRANIE